MSAAKRRAASRCERGRGAHERAANTGVIIRTFVRVKQVNSALTSMLLHIYLTSTRSQQNDETSAAKESAKEEVGAGLRSERMQQDAQGRQRGALTHNNKNKISLSGDQDHEVPEEVKVEQYGELFVVLSRDDSVSPSPRSPHPLSPQ